MQLGKGAWRREKGFAVHDQQQATICGCHRTFINFKHHTSGLKAFVVLTACSSFELIQQDLASIS
jgi:hypothetical protein